MANLFFTSDLHIGHAKVADIRVLEDCSAEDKIALHDQMLAEAWDACVTASDQIWVLGDISSGADRAQRNALQWISERPGTKHLIAGNHDRCHPMHRDSHRWQPRYLEVFESVQPFARRRIAGQSVLLSHFPYAGSPAADHTAEERYPQWRLPFMGEWLLHGHVHSDRWLTAATGDPGEATQKEHLRQFHVGVDAWDLQPVPLDLIEVIVASVGSIAADP